VGVHAVETTQYPTEGLAGASHDLMEVDGQAPGSSVPPEKKSTKRKRHDPDTDPRSTVHSSKNEGQHTDKRYLCYLCNKLFTRRRSVRDHIAKIHDLKTFEPTRSLEVTVNPITGEPVEPIEEIIARGPPPPPEKSVKPKKEKPPKTDIDTLPKHEAVPSTGDNNGGDGDLDLGDFPDESAQAPSTMTSVKQEPGQQTPISTQKTTLDLDTPGLASQKASSPTPPPQAIGKKRSAPDGNKTLPSTATKKGTAKPRAKKPKLADSDHASERSTPFRSPSATPVSARHPTSKLKKQLSLHSSPASSRAASLDPASPSPSIVDTPGSSNDDGEVFCVCRKGDNHTWMIACDGTCDEWYHGKCVNIKERDGDLIDKYICPRCTRSDYQTTWKRRCRRKGCHQPARVFQDPPSKYCSTKCGRLFFVDLLRRGDPSITTLEHDQYVADSHKSKKMRKKRKVVSKTPKESPRKPLGILHGDAIENTESRMATPAYSEDEKSEYETDSSDDDDDLPNRGGALRAGEVKALAASCNSIEAWNDLGRKPETPPPDTIDTKVELLLDDFEKRKLEDIELQKNENIARLELLDAKERFLEAVKTRSSGITDEVKKSFPKSKDLCGFDPRLAWNEQIFKDWYHHKGGKEILDAPKPRVGPPEVDATMNGTSQKLVNGVEDDSEGEGGKATKKGGICIRNKCSRHRQWARAQLAEIRFEQDVVKRNVRKTEELERSIKDRAAMRALQAV
jgi:COMPASS component SPP1